MNWKNQSGLTLVELLAAIAILSIIIFPILTLMTNSSTRTTIQGKESQISYFAQGIMEELQNDRNIRADIISNGGQRTGDCKLDEGCNLSSLALDDPDATYDITIDPVSYEGMGFYELVVTVQSIDVVAPSVTLLTVVRP
jgi:prepilin-type N-terminal cleavage/methylation domain-containing protein